MTTTTPGVSPTTTGTQLTSPSCGRQTTTGSRVWLGGPVTVMDWHNGSAAAGVQRAPHASRAAQAYLGIENL